MAIGLKDLRKRKISQQSSASEVKKTHELSKKKSLRPWEGSNNEDTVTRTLRAKVAVERAQNRLHIAPDQEKQQASLQTLEAKRRIEALEQLLHGEVKSEEDPVILEGKQAGMMSFVKYIFRC